MFSCRVGRGFGGFGGWWECVCDRTQVSYMDMMELWKYS